MVDTVSLKHKPSSNKNKTFRTYSYASLFIIFISLVFPLEKMGYSVCIFYNLTGLPCPGCGMGRSIIHFFHLRFSDSFYYHPYGIPMSVIMLYFSFHLFFPRLENIIYKFQKLWNHLMFAGLIFLLVFTCFRMYCILLFPERFSVYFYNFQDSKPLVDFIF